jgi:hypothetical protein
MRRGDARALACKHFADRRQKSKYVIASTGIHASFSYTGIGDG